MALQTPLVLISGAFSTLPPGDTLGPSTDPIAQASGNAGLVSASNKVPISGGYMTGQLFAASGVVVSGTLSRNGFNVVTVGDVETVTSTMIASGTIIDADVNISGAINATKLNFLQAGASGVARTVDSKLKDVVSVKDFGAIGNGVADDTAAFTNAVATGKTVFVPISTGGYVINNVPITTNTVIIGEKSGVFSGPSLLISLSNAAAFVPSDVTTSIFQIQIENFTVATTATSVTNAAFYRHSNKTHYTAYFNFTNIESSTNLEVVYDGFFIFGNWEGCRDGYIGNININTAHCAINSIPASFSQGNQTNLNVVKSCHFFGDTTSTNNASAIVDIAYGDSWTFLNCDFEGVKTTAVRLRGVGSVAFNSCWFERVNASANVVADITPSNPKGSGATFTDCYGLLGNTINRFATFGTASVGFFNTCNFNQIPAGVVLATGVVRQILNVSGNNAGGTFLSGYATAEFYLNGRAVLSGGMLSRENITITTSNTLISVKNSIYALLFVSGYANGSGVQAWWLVAVGAVPAVISSNDTTSTFPIFSEGVGGCFMRTTGGSLQVNVATIG